MPVTVEPVRPSDSARAIERSSVCWRRADAKPSLALSGAAIASRTASSRMSLSLPAGLAAMIDNAFSCSRTASACANLDAAISAARW